MTPDMITITLQSGPLTLPAGSTLAHLVEHLQMAPQRTTVAVDGQHVPRAQWMSHRLDDGQQVLFFQPIVGG